MKCQTPKCSLMVTDREQGQRVIWAKETNKRNIGGSHPAPHPGRRWAQEWCWVGCSSAPAVSVLWTSGTWPWIRGSPAARRPAQPEPEPSENTALCVVRCRKAGTASQPPGFCRTEQSERKREGETEMRSKPKHGCRKRASAKWDLAHSLAGSRLHRSQKPQTLAGRRWVLFFF